MHERVQREASPRDGASGGASERFGVDGHREMHRQPTVMRPSPVRVTAAHGHQQP